MSATVVIGAAQGMGEAAARRLAREPWAGRLVLADVQREKSETVAASLRAAGADATAFAVDLADPTSIERLVCESGEVTRVAIVAGIMNSHPALEMTAEIFERVMRVNLIGVYLAAQGFAKAMIDAGRAGSIVAVTSAGGRRPRPNLAAYCASKGGVAMALKVLGLSTLPKGVRINLVAPATTRTAMLRSDPQEMAKEIPLGRLNEPEDIAAAIVFMLSDDSAAVGLRELVVDGGSLLGL